MRCETCDRPAETWRPLVDLGGQGAQCLACRVSGAEHGGGRVFVAVDGDVLVWGDDVVSSLVSGDWWPV